MVSVRRSFSGDGRIEPFVILVRNFMQQYYVYILKCNDDSYYIGSTNDIDTRLAEHSAGQAGFYTAERLPVECIFLQAFPTRSEALTMEHTVKKWNRRKKEALIAGNWDQLKQASKKNFNK